MTSVSRRSIVRIGQGAASLLAAVALLLTAAPAGATPNALTITSFSVFGVPIALPGTLCPASSTATLDVVAATGGTWTTTMTALNLRATSNYPGSTTNYRLEFTLAATGNQTGTISAGYSLTQNLRLTGRGYAANPPTSCTFPTTPQCTFTDTYTGLTGTITGTGSGITGEVINTGSVLTLTGSGSRAIFGCPTPWNLFTHPANLSLTFTK